jgi:hypothetical protein
MPIFTEEGVRDWEAERDYDWQIPAVQPPGAFRNPFGSGPVTVGQRDRYNVAESAANFPPQDDYGPGQGLDYAEVVRRPVEGMWDDPYWGELDESGIPQRIYAYMFGAELDPGFEVDLLMSEPGEYGPPQNAGPDGVLGTGDDVPGLSAPVSTGLAYWSSVGELGEGDRGALAEDDLLTSANFQLRYDAERIDNTGSGWGADPDAQGAYATQDILGPNTVSEIWEFLQGANFLDAFGNVVGEPGDELNQYVNALMLNVDRREESAYWELLNMASRGETSAVAASYLQDWLGSPQQDQVLLDSSGNPDPQSNPWIGGIAPGSDLFNALFYSYPAEQRERTGVPGGTSTITSAYDPITGDPFLTLQELAALPQYQPGVGTTGTSPGINVQGIELGAAPRSGGALGGRKRDLSGRLITPQRRDLPKTPGRRATRKAEEGLLEGYFGGSLLGGGA